MYHLTDQQYKKSNIHTTFRYIKQFNNGMSTEPHNSTPFDLPTATKAKHHLMHIELVR